LPAEHGDGATGPMAGEPPIGCQKGILQAETALRPSPRRQTTIRLPMMSCQPLAELKEIRRSVGSGRRTKRGRRRGRARCQSATACLIQSADAKARWTARRKVVSARTAVVISNAKQEDGDRGSGGREYHHRLVSIGGTREP